MNVIDQLASSLGRRDEQPNQLLAASLARSSDREGIRELFQLLQHGSSGVQNDAIKVLYEVGRLRPGLIANHADVFLKLLDHKNNRLQWGAMMALSAITLEKPALIFSALPRILLAAEKGSVITKDNAVNVLLNLCSIKKYAGEAFLLLLEQLAHSPSNQFPMYAERMLSAVNDKNKLAFITALKKRLPGVEKESQRKRIERVLKKLQ